MVKVISHIDDTNFLLRIHVVSFIGFKYSLNVSVDLSSIVFKVIACRSVLNVCVYVHTVIQSDFLICPLKSLFDLIVFYIYLLVVFIP